jgi:hypothetical protein
VIGTDSRSHRQYNRESIKMHHKAWRRPAATIVLAIAAVTSLNVSAACKGQAENACVADASCTWVASYVRKDGAAVNGYCRSKGGNSAAAAGAKTAAATGKQ